MNLIIIALNLCSHWFPEATHVAVVNLLSIMNMLPSVGYCIMMSCIIL